MMHYIGSRFVLWCYYSFFRPTLKGILRRLTKLCELQRICYRTMPGAQRTLEVEYSLDHTRQPVIREAMRLLDDFVMNHGPSTDGIRLALNSFLVTVCECKRVRPNVHVPFVKSFVRCVEHTWGYKRLRQMTAALASTPYDSANDEHEHKLRQLWALLMPDDELEARVTRQWQLIGFQGDDPKTDFRGMGILGLDQLLYFAKTYTSLARLSLSHSMHPTQGYSFAIVGINLTHMAYTLLQTDEAKSHFYNVCFRMPDMDSFHRFYSYLFYEFDKFWIKSNPTNLMDFVLIRAKFEDNIRRSLGSTKCVLSLSNAVTEVV